MIDLSGQVALVTGASRGIGAATARRLAKAGARVSLMARSAHEIEVIASEIRADGGTATCVNGDVARQDDLFAAVLHCEEAHGGLSILVNNAGTIEPIARLADSDPDAWDRIIDVNLKGVYHGIRAALAPMLARGGGTIINLSSGAATSALEGWSHYCASKAAVLSLTRCTDREYREDNIRAIGLSPGTVATEMQVAIKASGINPVSKLTIADHISPEWVAEAIAWLCTRAGDPFLGSDFSLKTEEGRKLVGLVAS